METKPGTVLKTALDFEGLFAKGPPWVPEFEGGDFTMPAAWLAIMATIQRLQMDFGSKTRGMVVEWRQDDDTGTPRVSIAFPDTGQELLIWISREGNIARRQYSDLGNVSTTDVSRFLRDLPTTFEQERKGGRPKGSYDMQGLVKKMVMWQQFTEWRSRELDKQCRTWPPGPNPTQKRFIEERYPQSSVSTLQRSRKAYERFQKIRKQEEEAVK